MNIINFIGLSFDKQGFCGEQQFPAMYQQLTKNFISIAVQLQTIAVHKKLLADAAAFFLTSRDVRLAIAAAAALVGAAAASVVRHGGVSGLRTAVLHEGDFFGQEVIDAAAVDKLKRGTERGHEALDETGGGLLLSLHGAGGDETDVEVAHSEELDGIALLQVLLDIVGIAVEHVLHVARRCRRLGGNLCCHIFRGEHTVAYRLNTEHRLGVLLVEHHSSLHDFECFWHNK